MPRLRQNVIKTGVRLINMVYSRISLASIAEKLHLSSTHEAYTTIKKCIEDGIIDAHINEQEQCVESKVRCLNFSHVLI